jgi:hypothetical protein
MTDSPKPTPKTAAEKFGYFLGGFLLLALQAWALGVVLTWFGTVLTFWQCALLLLLFYSVRGDR